MNNNPESVKLGAKLLLEGAKMLNIPCPICRNPIYELRDGKLFCAQCKKEVIKAKTLEEDKTKTISHTSETDPIQRKISQLSDQLNEETDPDEIIRLAELIKKLQAL